MPLPQDTNEVVNAFVRGCASSEMLWEWACDALEAGCDSRGLRILASCTPPASLDDTARYFELALADSEIPKPSYEVALRDRLWLIASEYLSGELSLDAPTATRHALQLVNDEVVAQLNYAPDVAMWYHVQHALQDHSGLEDCSFEPCLYGDLTVWRARRIAGRLEVLSLMEKAGDLLSAEAEKFLSAYVPSFKVT